jgi:peroxiredoxin
VAATARPRLRAQLIALAAAAVIAAVGAVVWSRTIGDDAVADDVVRLDTPGVYVEPGAGTVPPLTTDRLPALALEAADGTSVDLAAGDGRPLVVNLWYSTCPPCARELADFADVHDEIGDEVRFVGVNPYDTAATMERFAADRGVTYELLRDPGFELSDALGIAAFPVTLFVDGDGRIVDRSGAIDDAELRERIAEHWG